jgi:UDP-glucose 4-epimerase
VPQGYIGSFTSLALLEHGYEVIVVDSLYNSSETSLDVSTGFSRAEEC